MNLSHGKIKLASAISRVDGTQLQTLYLADRKTRIDNMLFICTQTDTKLNLWIQYLDGLIRLLPVDFAFATGIVMTKEITTPLFLQAYEKIIAVADKNETIEYHINGSLWIPTTPAVSDEDTGEEITEESETGGYGEDGYGDYYG